MTSEAQQAAAWASNLRNDLEVAHREAAPGNTQTLFNLGAQAANAAIEDGRYYAELWHDGAHAFERVRELHKDSTLKPLEYYDARLWRQYDSLADAWSQDREPTLQDIHPFQVGVAKLLREMPVSDPAAAESLHWQNYLKWATALLIARKQDCRNLVLPTSLEDQTAQRSEDQTAQRYNATHLRISYAQTWLSVHVTDQTCTKFPEGQNVPAIVAVSKAAYTGLKHTHTALRRNPPHHDPAQPHATLQRAVSLATAEALDGRKYSIASLEHLFLKECAYRILTQVVRKHERSYGFNQTNE